VRTKLNKENKNKDNQKILLCLDIQIIIIDTSKILNNSAQTIPKTSASEYHEKNELTSKHTNDIIMRTQPTIQNFDNLLYFCTL
jgi:hypothetical protein